MLWYVPVHEGQAYHGEEEATQGGGCQVNISTFGAEMFVSLVLAGCHHQVLLSAGRYAHRLQDLHMSIPCFGAVCVW